MALDDGASRPTEESRRGRSLVGGDEHRHHRKVRAERALQDSEERFRSLILATTQITWTNDTDGKMRGEQPSWAAFTGQSRAEYEGYGWSRSVHPDDSASTVREWQAAVAEQRMFVGEHRVLRHDGEYRTCAIRAIPVLEPDGSIREWIGAHTDITEQRALEVQVKLLAERLAAAQGAARTGIFDWDLVSGTVHWSSELFALLGLAPDEVTPSADEWTRRIAEEDRDKGWQAFRDASEQKLPSFTLELRVLLPGGGTRWLRMANQIVYDGADRVVRVVGSANDIQALKEGAERERALREQAERALRFSEAFVGILGHDLRNPLSAISAAANLLTMRAETEKIAKPVSRIVVSADRMARMISQLLDFATIRLGDGLPLERHDADLARLARQIIEELEPVHERSIRLEVSGDTTGSWDSDRLGQLLSNLAANACHHGDPSVPILIVIDGTKPAVVRAEVRNGGTIATDRLRAVFEPLRSSERHKKRIGSSGLGLGLYITEQIALAHGGSIRVESSDSEGTRFIIDLPRRAPAGTARVFGDGSESSDVQDAHATGAAGADVEGASL